MSLARRLQGLAPVLAAGDVVALVDEAGVVRVDAVDLVDEVAKLG